MYFSEIVNRDRGPVSYPADLLDPSPKLRLLEIEAIQDIRELEIFMGVPATRGQFKHKTAQILSHILGNEVSGSLLSALKMEGLATSLGYSIWDETKDYSVSVCTIGLTEKRDGKVGTGVGDVFLLL